MSGMSGRENVSGYAARNQDEDAHDDADDDDDDDDEFSCLHVFTRCPATGYAGSTQNL